MSAAYPLNPLTRDDTFLGVCQAIGDDFGFNPIWLRIAFGVPLIFSPTGVLIAYFGLGAVVLLTRILFPNGRWRKATRTSAAPDAATAEPARAVPTPRADNEALAEVLATAA